MKITVVVLVVCVLAMAARAAAVDGDSTEFVHPERKPGREEYAFLDASTASYAGLMFRSLDVNHDKTLDEHDVEDSAPQLKQHAPGISKEDFASFIKLGDQNGDGKLDQNEFFHAMNEGLKQAAKDTIHDKVAALIEEEGIPKPNKVWKKAVKLGKALAKKVQKRMMGQMPSQAITGKIDMTDDSCVMCQYVVERMEVNVHAAGVLPGASLSAGVSPASRVGSRVFLEERATVSFPPISAAIEGTRDVTRLQRQAERQKYNEIWRVTDLTLDDTCEESMPNIYYGYCKALYQQQSQVVDGLRLQFRPADICYRIGMCTSKSYITQGIHTRYPQGKAISK